MVTALLNTPVPAACVHLVVKALMAVQRELVLAALPAVEELRSTTARAALLLFQARRRAL